MSHYDDDTLSRYALDPALVDDAESVAAHLRACDGCKGRMAELIEVDDVLRDVELWMTNTLEVPRRKGPCKSSESMRSRCL